MRNPLKIARDLVGSAELPADVLAWLSLEPVRFVTASTNRLMGRHILYQDPSGEVPVEAPGDPVGAMVEPSLTLDPADWQIVATQPTEANRFIWNGSGLSDPLMPSNHAAAIRLQVPATPRPYTFATQTVHVSSTGYLFDGRTDNSLLWGMESLGLSIWSADGSWRVGDYPFSGEESVVGFWVDGDGQFRFYQEGDGWGPIRSPFPVESVSNTITLGNHNSPGLGGNAWRGPIRHFAVIDRIEEDLDGLGAL